MTTVILVEFVEPQQGRYRPEVQRIRRALADGGTRLATDDELAAVRKKSKV